MAVSCAQAEKRVIPQAAEGGAAASNRYACHDDPMGGMRAARPTKTDVARLANVSAATVSYVLNDVAGQTISEQTRAAVHAAAKELGYRPNLAARNLAVGASGVMLYIVPRIALGELLLEVGSRLTAALARHGVVLSMQFETDDGQNVVDAVADLNPIAVTSVFPLSGAALAAVTAAGIPQIHLGSAQLHAMGALHLTIGELRIDHLVARGHRKLAFAGSDIPTLRPLGEYWLEGLRVAAVKRGLPELTVGGVASDGSDAADVVRGWMADGITAVCAQSDETAFVVLHGVRGAGLRCPEDLAVMGVDASTLGAVSAPPLTSVGFDAETIVDVSVAAMMTELGYPAGGEPSSANVARLIQRAST
jgi:DNA-binding LacI/PurR family transcriptional regulator